MSTIAPVHAGVGPVLAAERVATIDVVRGLAVLGILVMNIVEFAWPDEAYGNPAFAGGCTGADLWTWYAQTALFDGKMRALFSMLFGAGLVLIAERVERSGNALSATDVVLRRCLWLVPFGIVHRFFLQWTGDILYQYGLLGLIAVAFRHLRARTLLVLGTVWLLAFVPIGLRRYAQSCETRDQAAAAVVLQQKGEKVPEAMAFSQQRWDARANSIPPKPETLQKEIDDVRVGYWQLFRNRWDPPLQRASTTVSRRPSWAAPIGAKGVAVVTCPSSPGLVAGAAVAREAAAPRFSFVVLCLRPCQRSTLGAP